MKISEIIKQLKRIKNKYGDLAAVGHDLETPIIELTVATNMDDDNKRVEGTERVVFNEED